MTKQVRLRRGTTAQVDAFTGVVGEIVIDTDRLEVRIQNGAAGGLRVPRFGGDYTAANLTATGNVVLGDAAGDTVTVNGTPTFATAALFAAGTAALPSITRTGDLNTGLYFPAADTVGISTAGALRLTVDPAGNAGLGVTPSAWVAGSRALQFGALNSISDGSLSAAFGRNFYESATGVFRYIVNGSASVMSAENGGFAFRTAPTGTAGNPITFTQAMTLTQGGNFLVGTTSDIGSKLDVASSGVNLVADLRTSAGFSALFEFAGNGNGVGSASLAVGQLSDSSAVVSNRANAALIFGANNAEAARITSARYTKCSSDGTYIGSTGVYHEHVQSSTTATDRVRGTWHKATTGDNLFDTFFTEGTATARGSIDYNRAGGAVRYNTTSDGNLKNIKNPANLQDSVDLIMSIPIDEWSWKDDPNEWSQIGPIAQKLHQVFPGAVSVGGEYEETIPAVTEQRLLTEAVVVDGVEIEPATYETVVIEPEHTVTKYRAWGVDKTAPVWHLVATCQKQQAIIQAQQAQIEAILSRLTALESN